MASTGLEAFDTTVHKSNLWLSDIMKELGTHDRHLAFAALRGSLHAVRDRLPPEVAVHLAAQFPMLLRGLFYEGWQLTSRPSKIHLGDFLDFIDSHFRSTAVRPEPDVLASAVFKTVSSHVSRGVVEDVKQALPKDLRALWPN